MGEEEITQVRYRWGFWRQGCRKDEEVLAGLEPHSNLKSLTIDYYKGECYPPWLVHKASGDPSASFQLMNLVELKLFGCENVKNLPSLGEYPCLKFLEIEGLNSVRCIGNEFYMNGCDENKPLILFPALEILTLKNMPQDDEREGYGKDEEVLAVGASHKFESLTIVSYTGECYSAWLVGNPSGDPSV
ncbi:hypothetical protein V6N12_038030 [Hibiscus sabdariffa]|uniref:R13L1/DRL21-like LRR repeat region domain-containing protein n=1 Tax=Hibiscus sabdariffa TaxID=183260 RepID=A0ABR2BWD7_9ROSI